MQRLRDADLLLVPLFAIETVEQAEERPDLIRQKARVEEPILGDGLEQLVGVLDPIGDRVGGVFQLLDRLDQCRRLPAFILFRSASRKAVAFLRACALSVFKGADANCAYDPL